MLRLWRVHAGFAWKMENGKWKMENGKWKRKEMLLLSKEANQELMRNFYALYRAHQICTIKLIIFARLLNRFRYASVAIFSFAVTPVSQGKIRPRRALVGGAVGNPNGRGSLLFLIYF
jgi:hypothetical protein